MSQIDHIWCQSEMEPLTIPEIKNGEIKIKRVG
jgi:hypothetical protein